MGERELTRVRKILLDLPDVTERVSHGAPCFFIRNRIALCRLHDRHRGDERISLWCPLPAVLRDALLANASQQFFAPQPSASGTFGNWVGIFLDVDDVDWEQVAAIVTDAYRFVAPKTLVKRLADGHS